MFSTLIDKWVTGVSVACAATLLAACLILKLREWGFVSSRTLFKALRRPWFEVLLLLFFVGGMVQYGSTKGTNGADRSALMGLMRSPAPAVAPVAADSTGFAIPTNFPPITNLCFWGIEHGEDAVALGIAWPAAMSFTNDCIDIFGSHRLTGNGWWRLAQLDVGQIASNAIVELAYADLPTNAMCASAFYRLAAQDDSDCDGLSDKVEEWVLGTDPVQPDTDGDGLSDGDEIDGETDPRRMDSDGDGICDGEEGGCICRSPAFEWYDTTGWATTFGRPPGSGISSYDGAYALATLSNGPFVLGVGLTGAICPENGSVYLYSPGSFTYWVYPEIVRPLNVNYYTIGDIMVAAYWCGSTLPYGDSTSYIRTGAVSSNGCFVAEYHNVRLSWQTDARMTYQVIVPGGTGNVIRVSYHSSDIWIDGANAVVGVQNKRIATTNGCYNLTWDFSERGPILPQTTVEYHLGYGTSPTRRDTDGDGLDDAFETFVFHSSPLFADSDGDGLDDAREYAAGTDALSRDSDGDGLTDGVEVNQTHSNPLSGDSDGDGLTDAEEVAGGTDPACADTDGDGLDDRMEVSGGTNPLLADSDCDGLSDSQEMAVGTLPTQPDTDEDGMSDGWEWAYGETALPPQTGDAATTFDPLTHSSDDTDPLNDYSADPDGDGLTNGQEGDMGTNPRARDTDGDGVDDGAEIAQGSDPNDATDLGVANSRAVLQFYFGDHSDSHSEKYCLRLDPVSGSGLGATPRSHMRVNANYGSCETKTVVLVPGWKYAITLGHVGTNMADGPDYDYTLMPTGNIPANVTIEDDNSLLGEDETGTAFAGEGKTAELSICAVTKVSVCTPGDSSWAELDDSRVVLDNEALRVKVEIQPQVKTMTLCRQMFGDSLTVATSGTCPSGASVPFGDDAMLTNFSCKSEIRMTKTRQQLMALGLLPSSDEDSVDEMASYDVGTLAGNDGSDLSDCLAFEQMNLARRGRASNERTLTLDSNPSNAKLSESFFKAAGSEVLSVTYGGVGSSSRQIMNQADYFYYSGHGYHRDGSVDDFEPGVVSNHWQRDLDCVIFAGCSVLDINDYNNNFLNSEGVWDPEDHTSSPGKIWESIGPGILLGYNYYAPQDATGAPERIVRSWLNLRQSVGDADAWMKANDNANGRNACVIVKGEKYIYFKRTRHKFFAGRYSTYERAEMPKENWND